MQVPEPLKVLAVVYQEWAKIRLAHVFSQLFVAIHQDRLRLHFFAEICAKLLVGSSFKIPVNGRNLLLGHACRPVIEDLDSHGLIDHAFQVFCLASFGRSKAHRSVSGICFLEEELCLLVHEGIDLIDDQKVSFGHVEIL